MGGFTFSFRPRFVNPIRAGIGLLDFDHPRFAPSLGKIKRQTIRAERKDEKRPNVGDELHLFTGMRTKQCQRVAPRQTAFATAVLSLGMYFSASGLLRDVTIGDRLEEFSSRFADNDAFARADGFTSAVEMSAFWKIEHPDTTLFRGFITFWEARR